MRERFNEIYMRATGAKEPDGALHWWAGELDVPWDTVYSWASGRRTPRPQAERHIALIERAVSYGVYEHIRVEAET